MKVEESNPFHFHKMHTRFLEEANFERFIL